MPILHAKLFSSRNPIITAVFIAREIRYYHIYNTEIFIYTYRKIQVGVVFIESVQKMYAMVIGVVLLLVGLIGFVNAPILGIFGVNSAQNILHLVGGALGLYIASKGGAKGFNQWLGIIAAVVAVLGFIPITATLLDTLLAINFATTVLHAGIAIVSLGVAYGAKE